MQSSGIIHAGKMVLLRYNERFHLHVYLLLYAMQITGILLLCMQGGIYMHHFDLHTFSVRYRSTEEWCLKAIEYRLYSAAFLSTANEKWV